MVDKNQQFNRPLPPRVVDATLREGAQAPGVTFTVEDSVEIAKLLASLPVNMIECGHPSASVLEARRVSAVVAACGDVPVLAHARARPEDIDAVKASGAQWVGIFAGINDISKECRIRDIPIVNLVRDAIGYAKSLGLMVRYSVEDASRTSVEELMEAYSIALSAGADRLCFADTVGVLCPWETEEYVSRLLEQLGDCDLEVHLHDDRGLANANALSAVRAGANWVSSSVNGIGERTGITDTNALLVNLSALNLRALPDGQKMQHLSKVVQSHTRLQVDQWRPFVGSNAFTHTAKLHQIAAKRNERAYSWIDPQKLGRDCSFEENTLPESLDYLINNPDIISATELKHHRHGPGDRYLMMDDRVVRGAQQYCIVRNIPKMDDYGQGHVDAHRHNVDSLFLFIGNEDDLSGLSVEVKLGERTNMVNSPSSVFIPSGMMHSYRVVSGAGQFINHVLAGDYNSSLLDHSLLEKTDDNPTQLGLSGSFKNNEEVQMLDDRDSELANQEQLRSNAMCHLTNYVNGHHPGAALTPETRVDSVFDSLAYLDFFLHMEGQVGEGISLDELSACQTFDELAEIMVRRYPKDFIGSQSLLHNQKQENMIAGT